MININIKNAQRVLSIFLSLYGGEAKSFELSLAGSAAVVEEEEMACAKFAAMPNVTFKIPKGMSPSQACSDAVEPFISGFQGLEDLRIICLIKYLTNQDYESRQMIDRIDEFLYKPQIICLNGAGDNGVTIGTEAIQFVVDIFGVRNLVILGHRAAIIDRPIADFMSFMLNIDRNVQDDPDNRANMISIFGPVLGEDLMKLKRVGRYFKSDRTRLTEILKSYNRLYRIGSHQNNIYRESSQGIEVTPSRTSMFSSKGIAGQSFIEFAMLNINIRTCFVIPNGVSLGRAESRELDILFVKKETELLSLALSLEELGQKLNSVLGKCIDHANRNGIETNALDAAIVDLEQISTAKLQVYQSFYWTNEKPLTPASIDQSMITSASWFSNPTVDIKKALTNIVQAVLSYPCEGVTQETRDLFSKAFRYSFNEHVLAELDSQSRSLLNGLWGIQEIRDLFSAAQFLEWLSIGKITDGKSILDDLDEQLS